MSEVIEKLKVEKYEARLILNLPKDVEDFNGIDFDTKKSKVKYDLIFAFIFSLKEFIEYVELVIKKDLLYTGGYLYIVYPKRGNKQYKEYIGRDDFFEQVVMGADGYVNGSGLKFSKVASFNEVFSVMGLRQQVPRPPTAIKVSQCVDDYIDRIPDLQKYFANNPPILAFYNSLTYGYRKDWARYVYSARTEETIQKRLQEMEDILKQGYKTKDLYRQQKK